MMGGGGGGGAGPAALGAVVAAPDGLLMAARVEGRRYRNAMGGPGFCAVSKRAVLEETGNEESCVCQ